MRKSILFKGETGDKMEIYIRDDGQLVVHMDVENLLMVERDESKYINFKKADLGELIKTLVEFEKEMKE